MLKSSGPRMLPFGTSEVTGNLSGQVMFIRKAWYREVKQLRNHSFSAIKANYKTRYSSVAANLQFIIYRLYLSVCRTAKIKIRLDFLCSQQVYSYFAKSCRQIWQRVLPFILFTSQYSISGAVCLSCRSRKEFTLFFLPYFYL